MASGASAVELKVLISVLQESGGLKALLTDVQSLLIALRKIDSVKLQAVASQIGGIQEALAAAKKKALEGVGAKGSEKPVEIPTKLSEPKTDEVVAVEKKLEADTVVIPSRISEPEVDAVRAAATKLEEGGLAGGPPVKPPGNEEAVGVKGFGDATDYATMAMLRLDGAVSKVRSGLKFLMGGFLALEGVRFLKDLADTAARWQVLATVLHIVANNAGISTERIDEIDKSIQKLGITASASRQSLVQFMQSGLKIDYAPKLARAAQDLAVVAGWNSSQTFQRMIVNIQQLDVMGLRWMGIVVQRVQAEERFKQLHKEITGELTQRQKQEALMVAVLEKAAGLEGAYAAAMGDVGKQLTSMERYTETLRAKLGEGLLPAYLALVEEFTIFLRYLTVTAEEMNANKDAAEALGDEVRSWAQALRHAAQWVVDHWKMIKLLIEIYVAWKVAALAARAIMFMSWKGAAFIEFLLSARLAMQAFMAGQVSLKVAMAAVRAGSVEAAAGILSAGTAATTAGAAATGAAGGFTAMGLAMGALKLGLIIGLLALLWEGLKKIWQALKDANKAWEEGKLWQHLTKQDRDNAAARAFDSLVEWFTSSPLEKAKQNLVQAIEAEGEATTALTKAMKGGTQQELDAAKAALKNAKDHTAAVEEVWRQALTEDRNLDPVRKAAEERFIAEKKRFNELRQAGETAMQAEEELFKGKWKFGDRGEAISQQAMTDVAALNKLMDTYDTVTAIARKDANSLTQAEKDFAAAHGEMMGRLRQGVKETAGTITTPTAYLQFTEALDRFKRIARTPADQQLAKDAQAIANLKVQEERRQFTAPLLAKSKEQWKIYTDAIIQNIKHQLEIVKQANAQQEQSDRKLYDNGLMTVEDFYRRKRERIVREAAFERRIQEEQIRQLEGQRARAATPEEAGQIQNQITAARHTLSRLTAATQAQTQAATDQEAAELKQLNRQVQDLALGTAAAMGGVDAKIDQINVKYERMTEQLKNVKGASDAIRAAWEADIFNAQMEERNRLVQGQIDYLNRLLSLEQARLDVEVAEGNLTEGQAIKARNTLIAQQIDMIESQIESKQREYDRIDARYQDLQTRLRSELAAKGLSQEEIDYRVAESLSALAQQMNGVSGEMTELQIQAMQLGMSIETYGKRLRQVFSESLAQAIADSMRNIKDAQNALIRFSQALRDQIINTFARNLAERITKAIEKGTTDAEGNSIFDKVFKWIGLGSQKPDGSRTKPYVVEPGTGWKQIPSVTTQEETGVPTGAKGPVIPGIGELQPNIDRMVNQITNSLQGFADSLKKMFSGGGGTPQLNPLLFLPGGLFAEGGLVTGEGTGESDSIVARVSAGEHIMPAKKTKEWLPLLESIRAGKLDKVAKGGVSKFMDVMQKMPDRIPQFAVGGLVAVQSIAIPSVVPKTYATGGIVVADAGAPSVMPAQAGGTGNMIVSLHPDALNMTMREWLEHEVVRQHSRR